MNIKKILLAVTILALIGLGGFALTQTQRPAENLGVVAQKTAVADAHITAQAVQTTINKKNRLTQLPERIFSKGDSTQKVVLKLSDQKNIKPLKASVHH